MSLSQFISVYSSVSASVKGSAVWLSISIWPIFSPFTNKGITIITQPSARVFASFDGKVLYASKFRKYGPVLIIDHGDGFSTVMIGLGRIDVRIGQSLLEGEPVGVMNKFIGSTSQSGPNLYLELRRHGKPVNPLAWLSPKRNAT